MLRRRPAAAFTPGPRLGTGLDDTLDSPQQVRDEQRLADPVTVRETSQDDDR
ncbi:hypothetical protein [Nonomuraea turkmeniaca]|uniref:hypothetical protein n=1 Tax=Nonomuraea turkmeniaca TaxID=103838 RepID=UPI001476C1B0|nr:hypothetical protein [Nonomuraea turkmeniaca]